MSDRASSVSVAPLFEPFTAGTLELRNRIVMAPMTRAFAPDGVPGEEFAQYYERRAAGEVGLIVTQGTWIPHYSASNNPAVPRFHGEDALAGWKRVVDDVHAAGGRIVPQLWHVGLFVRDGEAPPPWPTGGPSGLDRTGRRVADPMTVADIDAVIEAFAASAVVAQELGFDGVELHGAHGYLIDQFLWGVTNQRTDGYGGSLEARTRLAIEIVSEIRRRVGPDFPLIFRFSQWKGQDYAARLVDTPEDLGRLLEPLTAAGIDIYHCSTRRFWEPEFEGSDLNLAGWAKKLTGKPTITVGSVGLDVEFTRRDLRAEVTGLEPLLERLVRGEFDLVALGRTLLSNPSWPAAVRQGRHEELLAYQPAVLETLV